MRIFISWSGETSRALADVLRRWLPSVIQASKPYFSPDDITKGTRWSTEIAQELNESRLGLICLTADNLNAPWIMFEAGALSKNIGTSRVIPLLFNIEPSDLVGPMTQFQAAQFSEEELRRVVVAINTELNEQHRLAPEVVQDVFSMWWPRLQERVSEVLAGASTITQAPARSEKDILEEVLALARSLSKIGGPTDRDGVSHKVIEDLIIAVNQILLLLQATHIVESPALVEAIDKLEKPLLYAVGRIGGAGRSLKAGFPNRAELQAVIREVRKHAQEEDEDIPF